MSSDLAAKGARALSISTIAFFALFAAACTPSLPEPESTGARLYENRCASCHRLYPPNVMTSATWEVMVKRMQGEMRRRGIAPLTIDESSVLLNYLGRHALNSGDSHDKS